MKTHRKDGKLWSHPHFDVRHNRDGTAVTHTHPQHSKPHKFPGTHFCRRLNGPQNCWIRTDGIGHLKIPNEPTGNRTRNLPSCGAVPQPTASPSYTIPKSLTCRHEKKYIKLEIILFRRDPKVKNKLIWLSGKVVKMIDSKSLHNCGVWRCDAASLGQQFPTFGPTVLPSSSMSNNARKMSVWPCKENCYDPSEPRGTLAPKMQHRKI